jgi:hypothetical protein
MPNAPEEASGINNNNNNNNNNNEEKDVEIYTVMSMIRM